MFKKISLMLMFIIGILLITSCSNSKKDEKANKDVKEQKVLKVVAETIAKEMTPLNIFGRVDEKSFAVYFFNTDAKNVFIWAEKLRVKIARKPIAIVSKQNTYTISIGVASTHSKLDTDEVMHNAELALQKAIEKGGNAVRNIS